MEWEKWGHGRAPHPLTRPRLMPQTAVRRAKNGWGRPPLASFIILTGRYGRAPHPLTHTRLMPPTAVRRAKNGWDGRTSSFFLHHFNGVIRPCPLIHLPAPASYRRRPGVEWRKLEYGRAGCCCRAAGPAQCAKDGVRHGREAVRALFMSIKIMCTPIYGLNLGTDWKNKRTPSENT
jgi:hypothetical protein